MWIFVKGGELKIFPFFFLWHQNTFTYLKIQNCMQLSGWEGDSFPLRIQEKPKYLLSWNTATGGMDTKLKLAK